MYQRQMIEYIGDIDSLIFIYSGDDNSIILADGRNYLINQIQNEFDNDIRHLLF